MSKTISVADDVYEWMKRRKKEKSFSEFIRGFMKEGDLSEIEGIGFARDWEETDEAIGDSSEKNRKRIEERFG
jgi:predicted CopG family antitoxin